MDQHFIHMKGYEVPEVIKEIGKDHSGGIIKASTGLDLKELKTEIPDKKSLARVMMQWAMEAFSNPEVITDTLKYIHKNKMISNEFMNDFNMTNLSILKYTGLLPLISKIIRPVTNGTPIQRANTYTYKTEDFMLATSQKYHPGGFGDQQHIWAATISPDISIFTTHPASPLSDEGALSASPNYWVGNGRNPHSVQHENVNLTMYVVEGKTGFMEKALLEETHCYFPEHLMDEAEITESIAFGRKGNTLIAVLATGGIVQKGDELIQKGRKTCWVTELSSTVNETFDAFKNRISLNSIKFAETEKNLQYTSNNLQHSLSYKGDYQINNEKQVLDYGRFESPYSETKRKDSVIEIKHNGKALLLDFNRGVRDVRN